MTDLNGNRTQRDLVQFVEFSEFKDNGVELARQVLEELPRQVEEYHMLVGMTPADYKKQAMNTDINYQMAKRWGAGGGFDLSGYFYWVNN